MIISLNDYKNLYKNFKILLINNNISDIRIRCYTYLVLTYVLILVNTFVDIRRKNDDVDDILFL